MDPQIISLKYWMAAILMGTLATFLCRTLSFAIFKRAHSMPTLEFVGNALPPAAILILILYCLKDPAIHFFQTGWKEIVSAAFVVVLQVTFKKPSLSIFAGAGLCVFLNTAYAGELACIETPTYKSPHEVQGFGRFVGSNVSCRWVFSGTRRRS